MIDKVTKISYNIIRKTKKAIPEGSGERWKI